MFTGIVEEMARVISIERDGGNTHFWLDCAFTSELKIDQSIAHNGACLTVVEINDSGYKVTAIEETLQKTNLNHWKKNDLVNVERCIKLSDRLDGHIVQGHVDQIGILDEIQEENGSYKLFISYKNQEFITVPKGSICLNGVSLTVVDAEPNRFSVAIIPYTWEHTNLSKIKVGDALNLEFDILGKYVQRLMLNKL